ncbi:MAG: lysophospholipid acyltransferase family protein [Desulfatibacillaceae bacterium]
MPGHAYCRVHVPLGGQGAGPGPGAGVYASDETLVLLQKILETLLELQKMQAQGQGMPPQDEEQVRQLIEKMCVFVAKKGEFLKRRMEGEYDVDEWGYDPEVLDEIMPILRFMYHTYWRVTTTGVENIPDSGRVLLVANHSGVVPWDAAMIQTAVAEEHPNPRPTRGLHLSLATDLPFISTLLSRMGHVQAMPENAERLLRGDHLTLVFPEGVKGIGKMYSERYQLARFGRGGFARVALDTGSPIIPVSVVGAEEIHPHLHNAKTLASILRIPYVPITPTFPLLGLLGAIPLPTKWYIHFDKPIPIQDIRCEPMQEPMLVSRITARVRETIQQNIYEILKSRRSIFL